LKEETMPRKRPNRDESESIERAPTPSLSRTAAFIRGAMLKGWPRIDLKHITEEGISHVRTWNISGDDDSDSENTENGAEALAHEVMVTAQEDAMVFGGHQKFFAVAYDKNNVQKHRFSFSVQSEDGQMGEENGPSESATPKGLIAQLMRHVEIQQRNVNGAVADIMAHYQMAAIEREKILASYQKREIEDMMLREQLVSNKHERDMAMLKEARTEKFQGEMVEKVMQLGNIAVTKFLTNGKPGEKPPPMLGEEILKGILGNVLADEKKLAIIANTLGPADSAALFELAKLYADRDARAEAKKGAIEKAGPPTPNGKG
jgi:hypothetical protein